MVSSFKINNIDTRVPLHESATNGPAPAIFTNGYKEIANSKVSNDYLEFAGLLHGRLCEKNSKTEATEIKAASPADSTPSPKTRKT